MNVSVEVYGCTANKSDARIVKGLLFSHPSYALVETIEEADLVIILTCTVIDTTEQRMISRIKQIIERGKSIVISGCMGSVQQKKIGKLFPKTIVVPPGQIHHLIDYIEQKPIDQDIRKYHADKLYEGLITPVSISEGCKYSCHYCITCKARGKLSSFPPETIYKDVETAIRAGCKEIQLTAQDTASYEPDKDTHLGDLLQHLSTIPGNFRLRVGMMNPRSVLLQLQSIIEGYDHEKIFTFLHLPVQSGDDRILDKMNRGYKIKDVHQIITAFRNQYPTLCLSTDIIVGYPGETEDQFHRSIDLLRSVQPDIINITRFSARPFTTAKTMNHRIPTEIVKQRSRTITEIAKKITSKTNASYIGSAFQVLVTNQKKTGSVLARAPNYKPVVIKKPLQLGTFHEVEIVDATPHFLIGTLK